METYTHTLLCSLHTIVGYRCTKIVNCFRLELICIPSSHEYVVHHAQRPAQGHAPTPMILNQVNITKLNDNNLLWIKVVFNIISIAKCTKFINRLTYHNMYISIFFLNLGETCCNERKISSKLKIFPSSIQTVSHLTHCNGHA